MDAEAPLAVDVHVDVFQRSGQIAIGGIDRGAHGLQDIVGGQALVGGNLR